MTFTEFKVPRMETAMFTKQIYDRFTTPVLNRIGHIGKGAVLAGAVAAMTLSTTPGTAYAGNGVGAAIGLGILGGAIAGAAIASTVPPAYAYPPAPVYGYPQQPNVGYYNYGPSPTYFGAAQPYYGWGPYYR
jgi:hypothetical protein